jgi:hypothetical protein
MKSTYTHILKSGLEVEFKRMMSNHQEWLSKGKSQKSTKAKTNKSDKNIDDVIADVLLKVGSLNIENYTHEEKLKVVQRMFSPDFKETLMAVRFFSVDVHFSERQQEFAKHLEQVALWKLRCEFVEEKKTADEIEALGHNVEALMEMSEDEPIYVSELPDHIFSFSYTWKDKDPETGALIETPQKYDMPVHFHEFKFEGPYKIFTELPTEDEKNQFLTLPIAGSNIRWSILDVELENKFKGQLNPDNVHINTPLKWRNPVELIAKTGGGTIPHQLNTSKMEIIDIELLRKEVFDKEGKSDTTIKIQHPQKEVLTTVDVLQVVTFFIPSGVA